ncbi:partial Validoxylamine A glucosyltransferase, partial [Anaerolineae bacterium]
MATNRISISAVICTHNRADCLPAAIESVLQQDLTPDRFELIVVDNRSNDGTHDVVSGFGDRVKLVKEPILGLSNARNAGWRAAQGVYVAMLDDDAVADPAWLRHILAAFEETRPEPACVGGRVWPIWESPRPAWLSDRTLLNLTVIDWSEVPHAVTDFQREWLAGANLAFPRAVL